VEFRRFGEELLALAGGMEVFALDHQCELPAEGFEQVALRQRERLVAGRHAQHAERALLPD
jgi:hypothetical protein